MKGRIGAKQLEFLIAHRRDSDGLVRFKPTRAGRPWPVMRSLARRHLIWIERRQVAYWRPRLSEWTEGSEVCWFSGLMADGLSVANRALKIAE